MLFKLETRLRRLVWRASNPTYGVFMTSCVLSLLAMKALATSYGPADTHRRRVAAESTYAKRRFYEVNDNPLYRLPENAVGGHRLDSMSPQQHRGATLSHH